MDVVYSPDHALHDPQSFLVRGLIQPAAEVPERAQMLHDAIVEEHRILPPQPHADSAIARIHTPDYLAFLRSAHARWSELPNAGPEVIPNVYPARTASPARPDNVVGQAGFHMGDGACPIGPTTWEAARLAADIALTTADLVRDGATHAYALCRPPGHHAFRDMASGFCYLNNIAIAAEHLRPTFGRSAIFDFDVHHGNGTQSVFWERDDVLFVSLHADTTSFHPYFWGHRHECGVGAGTGFNCNIPLPGGTDDDVFLEAVDAGLDRVASYAPGVLLVSAGFDAQENDPLGILNITTDGFRRVGEQLGLFARLHQLPAVLVQEGGYLCDELGLNLAAFLAGFETTRG
ncbi:MAG: histone deacetylase family protein [Rhodospirillales bacterium]|nr:histone deacetylase family protein [Rhodospirillales bacterium]